MRPGEIHATAIRAFDYFGTELRARSSAASCQHAAADFHADDDCDAAGYWRGEPRHHRRTGYERFVVRGSDERRDSIGAAIHRRRIDRATERRILSVSGKSRAGSRNSRKLRVHADACAVVAAAADSGDGSYVAGPVECAAVSIGSGADVRSDARAAGRDRSERTCARAECAVEDFGWRERDASDFAGA